MRKRKYRLWDGITKTMHYFGFAVDAEGGIQLYVFVLDEMRKKLDAQKASGRKVKEQTLDDFLGLVHLMDYVGLEDMRGKEIFEDDLLEFTLKEKTVVGLVCKEDACFRVKSVSMDADLTAGMARNAKVIGNRWKNIKTKAKYGL